jgi:hypothetical protein
VLVLSQYMDPKGALQLLEVATAGVGYVLKDRATEVESSSTPPNDTRMRPTPHHVRGPDDGRARATSTQPTHVRSDTRTCSD